MGNLSILGVMVDAKGAIRSLGSFSAGADKAGRATQKFERTTKNLNRALASLAGFFGTRQLIEYADTWTLISARIGIVTETIEQQMTIQQRLFDISQRTRNTLAATAVLYTRTALNADQLGRSHEELLIATEAVNAAMLLGGATGVEAAQGIRQLAQAFSKGKLDGDEFRTVMEAMPVVARAISDELGVTTGELQDFAEAGKITVQRVLDALINSHEMLIAQVESMPWTIGQAFQQVSNAVTRIVGILNQAFGISSKFADIMIAIAKNINKVVAVIGAMTIALIAYNVAQAITTGLVALAKWRKLHRELAITAAIMKQLHASSRGVMSVLIVIASATIGLIAYRKLLKEITEETDRWLAASADLDVLLGEGTDKAVSDKVKQDIADMIRLANQAIVLASLLGDAQENMEVKFDAVNQRIQARIDLVDQDLAAMLKAIDAEEELLFQVIAVEKAIEAQVDAFADRQRIIERFLKNVQRSFADTFTQIFEDGIEKFSDLFDAIKKLFIRLLAEMASAKLIESIGGQLSQSLSSVFGVSDEDRIKQAEAFEARLRGIRSNEAAVLGGEREEVQVVRIDGITAEASKSWSRFIAPALAGFFAGQLIGSQTTNTGLGALGGAAGGAAIGFQMGGPAGAAVGALAGALGGFIGASNKQAEVAEALRLQLEQNALIMEQNNLHLKEMRDAFTGKPNRILLDVLQTPTLQNILNPLPGRTARPRNLNALDPAERALIIAAAEQLGIQLLNDQGEIVAGALEALAEAAEFAIVQLTQWGNTLSDQRSMIQARNQLFGIEDTPQQGLDDAFEILSTLAPDLLEMLGLTDVDLNTKEGRAIFEEGLREIFRMILAGDFTNDPALLGAFANKDELIDAILNASVALEEFAKIMFDVVTDFPRAMDIAFFEQKFGTFGTSTTSTGHLTPTDPIVFQPTKPTGPIGFLPTGQDPVVTWQVGTITIINEGNESGEDILVKIEQAAVRRRARGGSIDVDRTDESLF